MNKKYFAVQTFGSRQPAFARALALALTIIMVAGLFIFNTGGTFASDPAPEGGEVVSSLGDEEGLPEDGEAEAEAVTPLGEEEGEVVPLAPTPAPESDFLFDAGTGTITVYLGSETDLWIPDTIGGVPVTAIGDLVFRNKGLTNVILPTSLQTIGNGAFQENALTAVDIPDSASTIGESAFAFNDLAVIDLPAGLTSLGEFAFRGNEIASVTTSGASAWPTNLTGLSKGIFIDNKLTAIPDLNGTGIVSIGESAFELNSFVSVDIPAAVTTYGTRVFANNGRYVEITGGNANIHTTSYAGAFGEIVAPATIHVTYVNANGEEVYAPDVIASDLTVQVAAAEALLFVGNSSYPLSVKQLSGYKFVTAVGGTVQAGRTQVAVSLTSSSVDVKLIYAVAGSPPVITGADPLQITPGSAPITEAMLQDGVVATDIDGTDITGSISITNSDGSQISYPLSTASPITYNIKYSVTDTQTPAPKTTEIIRTITVAADPMDIEIGGGWQYRDFVYATVQNYLSGSNSYDGENLYSVVGFSASGAAKYEAGNRTLVLPGKHPVSGTPVTGIGGMTTETAQPAIAQAVPGVALNAEGKNYFAYGDFVSIDLSGMKDLKRIGYQSFYSSATSNGINLSGLTKLDTIASNAFYSSDFDGDFNLSTLSSLSLIGASAFYSYSGTGGTLDLHGLSNLKTISASAFFSFKGNSLDLKGLVSLEALNAMSNSTFGVFQSYNGADLDLSDLVSLKTIGTKTFASYVGTNKKLDLSKLKNLENIGTAAFGSYQGSGQVLDFSGLSKLNSIWDSAFNQFVGTEIKLEGLTGLTSIANMVFSGFVGTDSVLDFSDCINLTNMGYSFKNFNGKDLIFGSLPKLTAIGNPSAGYVFEKYQGIGKTLDLSGLPAVSVLERSVFYSFIGDEIIFTGMDSLHTIRYNAFNKFTGEMTSLHDIGAHLIEINNNAFYSYNPIDPADYIDFTKFPKLTDLRGFNSYNPDAALDFTQCPKIGTINIKAQDNGNTLIASSISFPGYVGADKVLDLSQQKSLKVFYTEAFKSYIGSGTTLDLSNLTALESIGESAFNSFNGTHLDLSNLHAVTWIGTDCFRNYNGYMLDLSDLTALVSLRNGNGERMNMGGAFGGGQHGTVMRGFENLVNLSLLGPNTFGARYPENGVLDLSNTKLGVEPFSWSNWIGQEYGILGTVPAFRLEGYGDIIVYLPRTLKHINLLSFVGVQSSPPFRPSDVPTEIYFFTENTPVADENWIDPATAGDTFRVVGNPIGDVNNMYLIHEANHKRFYGGTTPNAKTLVDYYINNLGVTAVCKENDTNGTLIGNFPVHLYGKVGDPLTVTAPLVPGYKQTAADKLISPKTIASAALKGNTLEFYYEKDTKNVGSTITLDIHNLKNPDTGLPHTTYTIGEDMPLEVSFSASGNARIMEDTTIVIPLGEFAENVRVTGDVVGPAPKMIKDWYTKEGNLYVVLNQFDLRAGAASFQFAQQYKKYDTPWDRTEQFAAFMYGSMEKWSGNWSDETNLETIGSTANPALLGIDEDYQAKLIGFEYRQPTLRKYANGEWEDEPVWVNIGQIAGGGGAVVGTGRGQAGDAVLNPDDTAADADALADLNAVTYTYEVRGQYYRYVNQFKLYDKIPVYQDKSGNPHYAIFEEESNPNWTLLWGKIVTPSAAAITSAVSGTSCFVPLDKAAGGEPYAVYTSPVFNKTVTIPNSSIPALKIKFPAAYVEQSPVLNTAHIEAFVNNCSNNKNNTWPDENTLNDGRRPANNDKYSFLATDDITVGLYAYGPGGVGGFNKRAESIHYSRNRGYYFYDNPIEKSAVYSWGIGLSNAQVGPMTNIKIEDYGLDKHGYTSYDPAHPNSKWDDGLAADFGQRMQYYGLKLPDIGADHTVRIEAYNAETGGDKIVDDQADGGTTYVFEKAKREGIKRIVISFPGYTLPSGKSLHLKLLTELKAAYWGKTDMLYTPVHTGNPTADSITEMLAKAENKFPNWASYDADVTIDGVKTPMHSEASDWIRIIPIRNALTVTKHAEVAGGHTILNANTPIDYTVGFTGERAPGFEPTNFVLVDLLPVDVELLSVELSDLMKKSPNARYEIDVNYKGTGRTAVIFKADQVNVDPSGEFGEQEVGYIQAKMGVTLTDPSGAQRIYNEAFLYADTGNPSENYPFVLGHKLTGAGAADNAETRRVMHELGYSEDDIDRYFEAVWGTGWTNGAYQDIAGGNKNVSYAVISNQALKGQYYRGIKWIRKEGGAWSTYGVYTEPGGAVYYRLDIVNQTEYPRSKVMAWDIFPYVGDKLLDNSGSGTPPGRGTQFRNTLAEAVTLPANLVSRGWVVLYTIDPNAVNTREFMLDGSKWDTAAALGIADTGSTTWADVTGIKIVAGKVAGENYDLGPMESVHIPYKMYAPTNPDLAGKRAWNTFSVTDDLADGRPLEANNVWNEIPQPKRNVIVQKNDDQGKPLPGATFQLIDADTGKVIATQISDSTGAVRFLDVPSTLPLNTAPPEGHFVNLTVKETSPPAGYTGSLVEIYIPNAAWTPSAWSDKNGPYVFPGTQTEDGYTLKYEGPPAYALTYSAEKSFVNTKTPPPPDLGIIELEKVGFDGTSLNGARFSIVQITALGGSIVSGGTNVVRTTSGGKLRAADLPVGCYRVTEISAPGHLAPNFTLDVEVEKDKVTYIGERNGIPGFAVNDKTNISPIVNKDAVFSLVKIGIYLKNHQGLPNAELDASMGEKRKDVEFTLYDGTAAAYAANPGAAVPAVGVAYAPATSAPVHGITGPDGKLSFSGLKSGVHYTLVEKNPGTGFTMRPGAVAAAGPGGVLGTEDDLFLGVYDIFITFDGKILLDGVEIITSDLVIGNDADSLNFRALIAKVDQAGTPLPGVSFTVATDAKGANAITVGPTDSPNGTIALTDVDFEAVKTTNAALYNAFMAGLPLYVTEVDPPVGYTKPAVPDQWQIYRGLGYQAHTFTNIKTTLDLFKYEVVAEDLEETLQYLGLSGILERVLTDEGSSHKVKLSDLTEGEKIDLIAALALRSNLVTEPANIAAATGELELRQGVAGATLRVSIKSFPATPFVPYPDPSYTGFEAVTDSSGRIPVPAGFLFESDKTYEVKEIAAPTGYILSTKTLTFKPDTLKGQPGWTGVVSLEFENRAEVGQVVVTKLSEQGGKTLAGVTFGIYKNTGSNANPSVGDPVQTKVTDGNGLAVFKNLPYGKYVVAEDAVPSEMVGVYEPNLNLYAVEVSAKDQTVYVTVYNAEVDRRYSVLLTKYDDRGTPGDPSDDKLMADVKFYLQKKPIPFIGLWLDCEGEDALGKYGSDPDPAAEYPLRATDGNGHLYFGNLKSGTYRIIEIRDASKYLEPKYTDGGGNALTGDAKNEFTVDAKQTSTLHVTAVNPLITIPRIADLALEKNVAAYQVEDQDAPVSGVYVWQDAVNDGSDNVTVAVGNLVLFKLRVWNEGRIPATPEEITDYIPEGLVFVKADDPVYKDIPVGSTGKTVGEINKYWTASAGKAGFSQLAKYDYVRARADGIAPRTLFVDPVLQPPSANLTAPIPAGNYANGKDKVSSFEIPILLKVVTDKTDTMVNWAEISRETAPDDPNQPYDPKNPDPVVEDADSTPDDDPNNDFADGKDGEDDIDSAQVTPLLLQIDVQIDKDTIRQTSSMYNTLYSTEKYENVGKDDERYRYDINFRSLSNMRLDEYIVTDPLESADPSLEQTRVEELWTPLAWGDVDGKVDVLYQTQSGSGQSFGAVPKTMDNGTDRAYSNTGWKVWALDLPANAPGPRTHLKVSDLGLAEGDYLTAIRFSYGSVKVGFTTLNTSKRSVNGQHRDLYTGKLDEDIVDAVAPLPAGEAQEIKSLSLAAASPLQVLGFRLLAAFRADAAPLGESGTGLTANRLEWRPSEDAPYYAQGAADAKGLASVTYLVKPPREAVGYEEIVSSAYSLGARVVLDPVDGSTQRQLKANDQDAVRTLTIGTFIPQIHPDPDEGEIVREDSFENKLENAAGIVYRGGRFVDSDGNPVKSLRRIPPKTADDMLPGLWTTAMFAAGTLIILLLIRRRGADKKARQTKTSGASAAAKTGVLLLAVTLLGGSALLWGSVDKAYAAAAPVNNTMEVEFRYAEGSDPQIPASIDRGGITWTYVSASEPVREGSVENTQTSVMRIISGRLRTDQLQAAQAMGIVLTPVDLRYERRVDKEISFTEEYEESASGYVPVGPLEWNDVTMLPQEWDFEVTSADNSARKDVVRLQIAETSFTPVSSEDGLPGRYQADCVYRGVESYLDTGYYTADARIELITGTGETDVWVVTATYAGPAIPIGEEEAEEIIVTEEIEEPTVPEATDEERLAAQTGNIFSDIANNNVPLGGLGATGAWSLLSFLLSAAGFISAAMILLTIRPRGNKYAKFGIQKLAAERGISSKLLGVFAVVTGVFTLAVWLLLDDLSQPMIWVNKWTVFVILVFIVHIALRILYQNRKMDEVRDDMEEDSISA